jgi:hypothetical protein
MRNLAPKMVFPEHKNGPFMLICDDFSPANMIVKNADDLEIIAVLDWEWSYAGPMQLYWSPPRWLLLQHPDLWEGNRLERYKHCLFLYLSILEQEEEDFPSSTTGTSIKPSALMRQQWEDGQAWFHHILLGCFHYLSDIPYTQLQAARPEFDDLANAVPATEVEHFVEMKMEHLKIYKAKLAERLGRARSNDLDDSPGTVTL